MAKLTKRILKFFNELPIFSFTIASTNALWPLITKLPMPLGEYIMQGKHKKVFAYIDKVIGRQMENFKPETPQAVQNAPIWICWLQGEANMPEVVQMCLAALRQNANGHPVNIVTFHNYSSFCFIPDYIIKAYKKGEIQHAHFADIIRTCLLYEHGGAWIDATLLTMYSIPEEIFTMHFYSCKTENKGLYVSEYKWSNFFLCATAHSSMFGFVRMCFFEYLKRKEAFVDYFMMDYFMKLGYNTIQKIKDDVDAVPYNNEEMHTLSKKINAPCSDEVWSVFLNQYGTVFYKLSWKTEYKEVCHNQTTYYGRLKKKYHS